MTGGASAKDPAKAAVVLRRLDFLDALHGLGATWLVLHDFPDQTKSRFARVGGQLGHQRWHWSYIVFRYQRVLAVLTRAGASERADATAELYAAPHFPHFPHCSITLSVDHRRFLSKFVPAILGYFLLEKTMPWDASHSKTARTLSTMLAILAGYLFAIPRNAGDMGSPKNRKTKAVCRLPMLEGTSS